MNLENSNAVSYTHLVSGERNQSEKLLPGRVRGKSLHIPAGGTDAPGGRVATGHRTAGGRDRGTGGLRKSK